MQNMTLPYNHRKFHLMTAKPHSIQIFLHDGLPDSVRTAQISMSTIFAIAFKRDQLARVNTELNELGRTGIYVLIGAEDSELDSPVAYIGESEDVSSRLKFHETRGEKPFWMDTIVLVSKDETFTKSHMRYAEAELIKAARTNLRWKLKNGNNPPSIGKLPKPDQVAMEEFINQTKTLVGTLGCNLFRVIGSTSTTTLQTVQISGLTVDSASFNLKGDGYSASAFVLHTGEFVIKAGSLARNETTNALSDSVRNERKNLEDSGVIIKSLDGLCFQTDYSTSSPSRAAQLITGYSLNGRISWKTVEGKSYAEWVKAPLEASISESFDGSSQMTASEPVLTI